jgi:low affinity Fe/Cu permease
MKSPSGLVVTLVMALVLLAATAPLLVRLSQALVPLVIVVGVAAVVVRLVFFHTRRW